MIYTIRIIQLLLSFLSLCFAAKPQLVATSTNTFPEAGAEGVSVGTTFLFVFDQPIAVGTNTSRIQIAPGDNIMCNDPRHVIISGLSMFIQRDFNKPLQVGTEYQLVADVGCVVSAADGDLWDGLSARQYTFTTAGKGTEDVQSPILLTTVPANLETVPPTNKLNIAMYFSEAIYITGDKNSIRIMEFDVDDVDMAGSTQLQIEPNNIKVTGMINIIPPHN